MTRFSTGNPEAHNYLDGIEGAECSPLDRMSDDQLDKHYEELMCNVSESVREDVECANFAPADEFIAERRRVFAALCRRGLRHWDVSV